MGGPPIILRHPLPLRLTIIIPLVLAYLWSSTLPQCMASLEVPTAGNDTCSLSSPYHSANLAGSENLRALIHHLGLSNELEAKQKNWNVGFWFGMKLYINRLSDGELSFEIRQPLYGLPLDHTIRDFGRALAQEQGWEIDGREAVKIEEAIKILYPFVPSLSHAEPEHTVFKHSALIRLLSMKYQYQSYLQIGCGWVDNYVSYATGGNWDGWPINHGGQTRIPGIRSSEFFASNTQSWDLILIIGCNEAQVLRDVQLALRVLSPGGTVMVHNALPTCEEGSKPRHPMDWLYIEECVLVENGSAECFWTGDAWRAIIRLRAFRGLEVVVVDIDEGCGLIRVRPNRKRLPDRYLTMDLDYKQHLRGNEVDMLQLATIPDAMRWLEEADSWLDQHQDTKAMRLQLGWSSSSSASGEKTARDLSSAVHVSFTDGESHDYAAIRRMGEGLQQCVAVNNEVVGCRNLTTAMMGKAKHTKEDKAAATITMPLKFFFNDLIPEAQSRFSSALTLRQPKAVVSSWLWDPRANTTCCYNTTIAMSKPNATWPYNSTVTPPPDDSAFVDEDDPHVPLSFSKCLAPNPPPLPLTCPVFVLYNPATALVETAHGLQDALARIGVTVILQAVNEPQTGVTYDPQALYIVLAPDFLPALPDKYILYQLEELVSWTELYPSYVNQTMAAQEVWEFSPWQLERYDTLLGGFPRISRIMPVYSPHAPLLSSLMAWEDQQDEIAEEVDVLFYGYKTPRRLEMKAMFQAWARDKGIRLRFILSYGLFGDAREDLIRRTKIVLNLHQHGPRILEVHRINYLLSKGKCVVSEPSLDTAMENMYEAAVVFSQLEDMFAVLEELLQDRHRRRQLGQAGLELMAQMQCDPQPLAQAILPLVLSPDSKDQGSRVHPNSMMQKQEWNQGTAGSAQLSR